MTAAPAGGGLAEVLALVAIDDALHRLHAAHNAAAGKQREVVAEEHGNLAEARAAIAELIEAATLLSSNIEFRIDDSRIMLHDGLRAALAKVASNGDRQ